MTLNWNFISLDMLSLFGHKMKRGKEKRQSQEKMTINPKPKNRQPKNSLSHNIYLILLNCCVYISVSKIEITLGKDHYQTSFAGCLGFCHIIFETHFLHLFLLLSFVIMAMRRSTMDNDKQAVGGGGGSLTEWHLRHFWCFDLLNMKMALLLLRSFQ